MNYITVFKDWYHISSDIKKKLTNANVFYTKGFFLFNKTKNKKIIYLTNNKYIIPVVQIKKLCFKYAQIPVEPFCFNNEIKDSYGLKLFLNQICEYLKKETYMWLQHPDTCASFIEKPENSIFIPFSNYFIDLSISNQNLFSNIHGKHRNSIRKALKSNVIVEYGKNKKLLDDYYHLSNITANRTQITPKSYKEYYNELKFIDSIIFIAYCNNIPQGGAIFYFNNKKAYYIHGASVDKPISGSMNLLHWMAMNYFKNLRVQKYSFVGARVNVDKNSKYDGIQKFKKRFGGKTEELYLFKKIFSNFFYSLFCKLMKIRAIILKINYKGDIIDQEIHKWKND
jgi:hypothetical protein